MKHTDRPEPGTELLDAVQELGQALRHGVVWALPRLLVTAIASLVGVACTLAAPAFAFVYEPWLALRVVALTSLVCVAGIPWQVQRRTVLVQLGRHTLAAVSSTVFVMLARQVVVGPPMFCSVVLLCRFFAEKDHVEAGGQRTRSWTKAPDRRRVATRTSTPLPMRSTKSTSVRRKGR